ncbi:hypothetical protein ABW19_dt0209412 [Dactylella cylindrospora]|nr:hypothetical protein ABW19_dt0209412 [Dactylella cylindrospora]
MGTDSPLAGDARWRWKPHSSRNGRRNNLCRAVNMPIPEMFSWIYYIESGGLTLQPDSFKDVVAISSEGSLFVASCLLSDPLDSQEAESIVCIPGNIGQSGICLLVPPTNPKFRSHEIDFLEHKDFDGKLINSFDSTTLHLNFTGYRIPLDPSNTGSRHQDTWVVEVALSVYDSGKWVSDIPARVVPNAPLVPRPSIRDCPVCETRYEAADRITLTENSEESITSLDSWEEFLQKPNNTAILRTKGNWVARVAALGLAATIDAKVEILDPRACVCDVGKSISSIDQTNSTRLRYFHNSMHVQAHVDGEAREIEFRELSRQRSISLDIDSDVESETWSQGNTALDLKYRADLDGQVWSEGNESDIENMDEFMCPVGCKLARGDNHPVLIM